jgi:hypothetical protein
MSDPEPAFPVKDMEEYDSCGMSLRDYLAGQALGGILAGGFADTVSHDDAEGGLQAAFFAYQYADAMLFVRKGRKV